MDYHLQKAVDQLKSLIGTIDSLNLPESDEHASVLEDIHQNAMALKQRAEVLLESIDPDNSDQVTMFDGDLA